MNWKIGKISIWIFIKMKQTRPADTSTTLPVVRCWKGVPPPSIHVVRCHFGRMLCGNRYLCLQFLKAFSFCPDFRPSISSLCCYFHYCWLLTVHLLRIAELMKCHKPRDREYLPCHLQSPLTHASSAHGVKRLQLLGQIIQQIEAGHNCGIECLKIHL